MTDPDYALKWSPGKLNDPFFFFKIFHILANINIVIVGCLRQGERRAGQSSRRLDATGRVPHLHNLTARDWLTPSLMLNIQTAPSAMD